MKRSFVREILEAINPDTVSFAGGLPDESLFPIEGIREATQRRYLLRRRSNTRLAAGWRV